MTSRTDNRDVVSVIAFCWLCTNETKTVFQAFGEVTPKLFLFISRGCTKPDTASTNKSHESFISSSGEISRYNSQGIRKVSSLPGRTLHVLGVEPDRRGNSLWQMSLPPLPFCFKRSCKSCLLWPLLGELRIGQRVKVLPVPAEFALLRPARQWRLWAGKCAALQRGPGGSETKGEEQIVHALKHNRGTGVEKCLSLKRTGFSVCFSLCVLSGYLNSRYSRYMSPWTLNTWGEKQKVSQYISAEPGNKHALSLCDPAMGGHLIPQRTAVQTSFLLNAIGLQKQSKAKQSSPKDTATVGSNTGCSEHLAFCQDLSLQSGGKGVPGSLSGRRKGTHSFPFWNSALLCYPIPEQRLWKAEKYLPHCCMCV